MTISARFDRVIRSVFRRGRATGLLMRRSASRRRGHRGVERSSPARRDPGLRPLLPAHSPSHPFTVSPSARTTYLAARGYSLHKQFKPCPVTPIEVRTPARTYSRAHVNHCLFHDFAFTLHAAMTVAQMCQPGAGLRGLDVDEWAAWILHPVASHRVIISTTPVNSDTTRPLCSIFVDVARCTHAASFEVGTMRMSRSV